VTISAFYPGASAETAQNSVTQVIEQQLTGVDNLLYFDLVQQFDGGVNITATFAPGTNPDIAQVQVENKVQQATPQLPQEVQQQGVVVTKSQTSFLLIVALYDDSGRYTNVDISDFLVSNLQDPDGAHSGRGPGADVRDRLCDAHLARSLQAQQLRADAHRCAERRAGAERASVGRRARRAADRSRARSSMRPSRRNRCCRRRSNSAPSF
jgi:hypothetical protein